MEYCFIILHYKTLTETISCIQCIKQLEPRDEIHIIVVDNASQDGSIESLKERFGKDDKILLVESEYNAGFAKGNNIGYLIAKYKYNPDFIIILNSDVYIKQIDFIALINSSYNQTGFYVLGPDIITKDNKHQNPVPYINDSIPKIKRTLFKSYLRLTKSYLPEWAAAFLRKSKKRMASNAETAYDKAIINCPLHGACLIFSSRFITRHEYAFYPETYLYGEEDILYYLGMRYNEKFVYSPVLQVFHQEDASANIRFSENRAKSRFVIKNSIRSLKALINLIKISEKVHEK